MTKEDRDFLNKIQDYADKVSADINPEILQNAEQIKKLRPILQEMAMVYKMDVPEVLIKYMDLATQSAAEEKQKSNKILENLLTDEK